MSCLSIYIIVYELNKLNKLTVCLVVCDKAQDSQSVLTTPLTLTKQTEHDSRNRLPIYTEPTASYFNKQSTILNQQFIILLRKMNETHIKDFILKHFKYILK